MRSRSRFLLVSPFAAVLLFADAPALYAQNAPQQHSLIRQLAPFADTATPGCDPKRSASCGSPPKSPGSSGPTPGPAKPPPPPSKPPPPPPPAPKKEPPPPPPPPPPAYKPPPPAPKPPPPAPKPPPPSWPSDGWENIPGFPLPWPGPGDDGDDPPPSNPGTTTPNPPIVNPGVPSRPAPPRPTGPDPVAVDEPDQPPAEEQPGVPAADEPEPVAEAEAEAEPVAEAEPAAEVGVSVEPIAVATPAPTPMVTFELPPVRPVAAPAPAPAPTVESAPTAPPLAIAFVVEPPEAAEHLAGLGRGDLRSLLLQVLARSNGELEGLTAGGDEASWSATGMLAGERLRWPRRIEIGDGVYLELVGADELGGEEAELLAAPDADGGRRFVVRLTLAYRLRIVSPLGEPFGEGIYRHGSEVSVGLLRDRVRTGSFLGFLSQDSRFLGWHGLDFTGANLRLTMKAPFDLHARWLADQLFPAALGTVVALLTLLRQPITLDWTSINLRRKLPWHAG